jgi:hypothetical protein
MLLGELSHISSGSFRAKNELLVLKFSAENDISAWYHIKTGDITLRG